MRRHTPPKITRSKRLLLVFICVGLVCARFMYAPPPTLAATVVRSASGATPADIQATVDQFRADIGGVNNGVGGGSFSGRREINWDGVPDNFAAPNNLPADFFNKNSPRGVVFSTPGGSGFQVSAKANNPTNTPVRFGNLNANYPASFQTFSPERLFTPLSSTATIISFFVPGTNIPATVNGFGAVFTDVDSNTSTFLRCFDQNGQLLAVQVVPPSNNGLSFVGMSFNAGERVGFVRIDSGNAVVGANDQDGTGSQSDVVVLDDFIYGEPQPNANQNYFRWSGGGADNKWSTPQNWVGGVAPTAGSTLEFPGGAAQLTNVNDFGTQNNPVTFNAVVISGSGYNIGFGFAQFSIGIQTTNTTGNNSVGGLNIANDMSIISGNPGTTLTFNGAVVVGNDKILTFDGAGDFIFAQIILKLGFGGLIKNGSGTMTVADGGFTSSGIRFDSGKVSLNAGTLVLNAQNSTIGVNGGTLATGKEFNGYASAGGIDATGAPSRRAERVGSASCWYQEVRRSMRRQPSTCSLTARIPASKSPVREIFQANTITST